MNTDSIDSLNRLSEIVIGCTHEVSNSLGTGFLEKVYENALAYEIRQHGLKVEQQQELQVRYKNQLVGSYVADLIVANELLVELKVVSALDPVHKAQCLNYLRATGLKLCLLVNFGRPRAEFKRIIWG